MPKTKRVVLYLRVSTDAQNTASQRQDLSEAWAERAKLQRGQSVRGPRHQRRQRARQTPLVRRSTEGRCAPRVRPYRRVEFRSARALPLYLVEVLQTIRDTGTGLYIHTQSVDTTTPAGRAMFGMLGIFSEFEREMIVARVNAGLARAKDAITRDGQFTSKAGKIRKRLGRPGSEPAKMEQARSELAKGTGIAKTARLVGLGTGTVHKLKREMTSAGQ